MVPGTSGLSKWCHRLGASVISPGEKIYAVGSGSPSCVSSIKVWSEALCSPHSPVELTLRGVSLALPVRVRVKWKVFPTGCLRGPPQLPWAWNTGATGGLGLEVARGQRV
eukprot:2324537-Pyramimonas_sp.AAC.1